MASYIGRRKFLATLGGAAAWPLAVRAQQRDQVRRIGILMLVGEADPQAQAELAALTTGLERLGWTEGQNVRIDYRWADGNVSRLQALAAQLVELRPDLVVAQGSAALAALRQATRTLPIVFADVTDPVGQGFVESLARPGGNVTGFAMFEFSMGGGNGLIYLKIWYRPRSALRFSSIHQHRRRRLRHYIFSP
jgi:putative tryptophan/tyrosine transport system substrate-binding protein